MDDAGSPIGPGRKCELVATCTLDERPVHLPVTRAWRSTESAMANRMSGDSWLAGPLAISSCSTVPERLIWLCDVGQRRHLGQERWA